jgi:RHS repeat-associated protein
VFDPYGERAIYDSSWSPISSSAYAWVIGHQGLLLDVESGLVYNRNRMLHVQLGRFAQRDPIDIGNLFEYERGSPAMGHDSDGLCPCLEASTPDFAICNSTKAKAAPQSPFDNIV